MTRESVFKCSNCGALSIGSCTVVCGCDEFFSKVAGKRVFMARWQPDLIGVCRGVYSTAFTDENVWTIEPKFRDASVT
jgi:hypothetical protein